VCDAPTIEPQRKKGTWIEQDDSWDGVYYECSACGEPWTLIDGTPWDNGMKFCPNCGAEMRDDDGE
jgi:predicted amidophosphoribosyltransferase